MARYRTRDIMGRAQGLALSKEDKQDSLMSYPGIALSTAKERAVMTTRRRKND
jgi:hypothetical protein